MKSINACSIFEIAPARVKNTLAHLFIIVLAMAVFQQKARGQVTPAGKTDQKITGVADMAARARKPGDPLAALPPNIERLTYFGERADISPDNKRSPSWPKALAMPW